MGAIMPSSGGDGAAGCRLLTSFSIILVRCLILVLAHHQPLVRISQGYVRGIIVESPPRNGSEILAFLGVPYAEPPVGDLRFRNPVKKKSWDGILDAFESGSACTQFEANNVNLTGSEDCLFLNVYTPRILAEEAPLPVMVYIHGGGYMSGSGSAELYGPDFLLPRVVLVTINYRLGIFGYLSTGDAAAAGNFGSKDQTVALEWVKENIRLFGGDPTNITLFGESAGSSNVNLHALSDRSKPLFNRYICQSGTVLYPWTVRTDPTYYEYSRKVARLYECPTLDSSSMVNCLRNLTAFELLNATNSVFDRVAKDLIILWGPTIEPPSEEAFLTATPEHLMREGRMKQESAILGTVEDEGLYVTTSLYVDERYELFLDYPLSVIERLLEYYEPAARHDNLTDLALKMKRFYFGREMPKDKNTVIEGYTRFITDLFFFYPQTQMMRYMLTNHKQPFYVYSFEYRGVLSMTARLLPYNFNVGVAHADDLFYLFPTDASYLGLPPNVTRSENDYKVKDLMVDLWTSFAATGVPTSTRLNNSFLWKPHSWRTSHLEIRQPHRSRLRHVFFKNRMDFWYENVHQFQLST